MIHIIGTSHIAHDSLVEVEQYIMQQKPDFICVELDKQRLAGLLHGGKSSLRGMLSVGVAGFFFLLIGGLVQRMLGKIVKVKPGTDMLLAVQLGKKENIPVALIDQPIHITLQRLSKQFRLIEFFRFLYDATIGPFFSKKLRLNLKKVPSEKVISHILELMETRYPSVYNSLLHERNIYMVKRLKYLQEQHPDAHIVAVVGAAHKKGMLELL